MKSWGQLLTIDLYDCDVKKFTKKDMKFFALEVCRKIKMVPYGKPLVKEFGKGKLNGISLMQFIETSSITMHSDKFGKRMFIDIFSCKKFNEKIAREYSKEFFNSKKIKSKNFLR